MTNTGYRAMIRDRVPFVVNLALIWTNSKTAWVEHVYKSFIGIYPSHNERDNAVRIVLGIKRRYKPFNFHSTIDWNNLKSESKNPYETISHWKFVEGWVDWFTANYAYIENAYAISITSGFDEKDTKSKIMQDYLGFLTEKEKEDMINLLIANFNVYD